MDPKHISFAAIYLAFSIFWGIFFGVYMLFKAENDFESIILHLGAAGGAAAVVSGLFAGPIWAILHFA